MKRLEISENNHMRLLVFTGILVAISMIQYSYSLFNDFVWDSRLYFLDDPTIQDPRYFFSYFTEGFNAFIKSSSGFYMPYYRPLIKILHLLEYQAFGTNPMGYNAVSILLNAVVVALAYVFLLRATKNNKVAFTAALLYAVHPIRVEAVSWAYSDSYLVFAAFMFLTLIFYDQKRHMAALVSFLLALLSRESAVLIPVVIVLYEYLLKGERRITAYKMPAVFFVVVAAFLALRTLVVGAIPLPDTEPSVFFNTAAVILKRLVKISFVPDAPVVLYKKELFAAASAEVIVSYAVLGVLIAAGLLLWQRNRHALFWYAWFLVWVSLAFDIGSLGDFMMAEKMLHISVLGICVLGGYVYSSASRWPKQALACLVVICVAWSGYTFYRTLFWHDTVTYLTKAIEHDDKFFRTRKKLGDEYVAHGKYVLALREFDATVALAPSHTNALNSKGNIHMILGQEKQAEDAWVRSTIAGTPNPLSYYNLGLLMEKRGMHQKALSYYNKYLALHSAPSPMAVERIMKFKAGVAKRTD